MNNIRAIEKLNQRELEAGIPLSASWHTDWSDTAYVYIGGLPYELSEGDIITIFSQFGEPVHVNLIRDKDTGKSKGFAFLKYEDQRSTNLAVDNLGGAIVLGRIIRVDHTRYKPKEGELEELVGQGSGPRVRDDDGESEHHSKRRRGKEREETPPREMLPEEIELQKLIRDHDEDDPMKEYLVRQKKEEVELALQKFKREKKKLRHQRDGDSKGGHRHSHRHRSRSKEGSRRHRSRSKERAHRERASEEPSNFRERDRDSRRGKDRDRDGGRDKDKESARDRSWDREGNTRSEKERGWDRRYGNSGHSSRREGRQRDD
ncbi:hypothetical protein B9Z19DRAFT_1116929 [Tuber borchii]|uniref:RRM domain-containing protein n=1 Tax=Tuber borchii TaxID=42251 RepID=A0A2T6ZFW5_TUBBO|nr:hypothetical protein B9Z19DRAFT_1116929 [Tuber borchii]